MLDGAVAEGAAPVLDGGEGDTRAGTAMLLSGNEAKVFMRAPGEAAEIAGVAHIVHVGDEYESWIHAAGDDRLDGGEGADRIEGGSGNDIAEGGAGRDRMQGDLVLVRVQCRPLERLADALSASLLFWLAGKCRPIGRRVAGAQPR